MTEALHFSESASDSEAPSRVVATGGAFGQRNIESRDSVSLYLEEISRTPLLEAEQEVELQKTIEAGLIAQRIVEGELDNVLDATDEELAWLAEEKDRAQQQFIKANLRLVVSIARKYSRAQMPLLDIIQEGNTGLMHAVELFDYAKGYKFSTYASWWVRQSITRGIAQQSKMVRLPHHVAEELNQVIKVSRTMERELGRSPEHDEVAAELGLPVARVIDLLSWSHDHISLDAPIGDDKEGTLGDLLLEEQAPGPDDYVVDSEDRAQLESWLAQLDERAATIVRNRYGLTDGRRHTQKEIAALYGISAERVRQIERQALMQVQILSKGGTIRSKKKADAPIEPVVGKRVSQRNEVRERLKEAEGRLSPADASVLQSFVDTPSYTAAGQEHHVSVVTFAARYKLAKLALDALVVGQS